MRLERDARIDRLISRHGDIAHVDGESGNGALIRKDQLLVAARDAAAVHEQASRWVARREDDPSGLTVLHLRPDAGVDVCELASQFSGRSPHKRVNAGPNHVVTTQPQWSPGPFDEPTPVDAIPAPPRPERPDAPKVNVAILDTGVAAHPWFEGRRWYADCATDVYEAPDADHDDRLDSVAGHGTFIAGVVLQQAPDAQLIVERIISGDGVTDERELLRALAGLRARADRSGKSIDVLSLSLGCYTHDDKPSPVLAQGFRAFDRDTVIVACAGNAGSDRPYWPAALKRVIAVGSLDAEAHDRAAFSNFGWWVDACTVGDHVTSSFFTFDDSGASRPEMFNGYATWSGTSFAAPRVAGAIAASAAARGISAARAAADLLDATTRPSMPDLGVLVDVPADGSP
jgi:subtilisin family serine protease